MKPARKIAILLYRYFPYGGLQKDFLEIAKELQSRDILLKVFTRTWEGNIPEGLLVTEEFSLFILFGFILEFFIACFAAIIANAVNLSILLSSFCEIYSFKSISHSPAI